MILYHGNMLLFISIIRSISYLLNEALLGSSWESDNLELGCAPDPSHNTVSGSAL